MKAIVLLLATTTVALSAPAPAQSAPLPPHIVTSGEGQTRIAPDRATVLIGVQTQKSTATAAASENARRQKAVLDTLKALGIPAEQLTTQNYSVNPELKYDPAGVVPPKITGYTVSNTVRVELKKIDQAGGVIDAALAKGANTIAGIQFGVSNIAEVRRLALADAVRAARADAEALAKSLGGSLGALIEMTSTTPAYRPVLAQMELRGISGGQVGTPVEAGEQVVAASVTATWQFIPGA
jgi:uncharacterized protein YggE